MLSQECQTSHSVESIGHLFVRGHKTSNSLSTFFPFLHDYYAKGRERIESPRRLNDEYTEHMYTLSILVSNLFYDR